MAWARTAAALVAVAAAAVGCGSAGTVAPSAPVLYVATGLYPISAVVAEIGGRAVHVVDVVPVGQDPLTWPLSAGAVGTVHGADLVVAAGGGLQPSFTAAATGARRILDLHADPTTAEPYVWLDPTAMKSVVAALTTAMAAADPPAAGAFRANARAVTDEIASTGIDYESTLGVCPRRAIVTADTAFAAVAHRYGITDRTLAATPDPAALSAGVAAVRSSGATEVYRETWVDDTTAQAVASLAHVKLGHLDPLTGAPPGGWPAHATYLQLLESNLGALSNGLGCPDSGTGVS